MEDTKKTPAELVADLMLDPGFVLVPQDRYEELIRAETERDVLEATIKGENSYNVDRVLAAIQKARKAMPREHRRRETMLNKIVVMGRLTRDPELRRTQSGLSVTSFSVACDRDFKSQSGEKETDFIDIVAWRQTAEFVCKYFSKGRMAVVEGRLQIRDWQDNNGNKRRSAEIVADNVYFGDSKRDGDGGGYPQGGYAPQGGYPQQGPSYGAPGGSSYGAASGGYPASDYGGDFAEVSEDDGELPF